MPSLHLQRTDVVVGVDTHKDQHVAVALDGIGGRLGSHASPATPDGYAALLAWAHSHGRVVAFGVEGTGTYGIGLARHLRRHGARIHEVSRPPRPGARRLAGKSDLVDAEHAAREVLSGGATSVPKLANGAAEALRLIKVARDPAVKARTQAINLLRAALVTSPDELRAELEGLTPARLIAACAGLSDGPDDGPAPAEPRGQPTGERGAPPDRHCPAQVARADAGLHGAADGRGADEERRHPVPQTVRRP